MIAHFPHPLTTLRAFRLLLAVLLGLALGPRALALDAAAFDGELREAMAVWGVPGMAVSVVEQGSLVFARGYGTTAVSDGRPVTPDTLFANASTTKAMIAAAALILVDEGRLSLDDPVQRHLPDFRLGDPRMASELTLRDLLTHRSGLPSTDFLVFNQGMSLDLQLPYLERVRPAAPPRSAFIYQNTGYQLVARVLERVSGEPWPVLLQTRLWGPLGMDRTFAKRGAIPDGLPRAWPHDEVRGVLRKIDHSFLPEQPNAAGSVWSTVNDMARWAQCLLSGGLNQAGERVLSEGAVAALFEPQVMLSEDEYYPTARLTEPAWRSYALGWYQQDFQGRKIDYHTGSLSGFVALLGLDRSQGKAIMVMANREGAELRHGALWRVMDGRAPEERPPWFAAVRDLYQARSMKRVAAWEALTSRRPYAPPTVPLRAYEGRYFSDTAGPLNLVLADDGSRLTLETRTRRYGLEPWHGDTFLVTFKDWNQGTFARFDLGPDGEVRGLSAFDATFLRQPGP